MRFPTGAATRTDLQAAAERNYDAVIVGAGISGAILANELSRAGRTVLLVDAGPGEDITVDGYDSYLETFYGQAVKDNQSPYPRNPNAPMPRSVDVRPVAAGQPETSGYLVQPGPFITDTTYTRVLGGTTMHWEAKTPRMLPEDFEMQSRFGHGPDWPISYAELEPFYQDAEREMGVAAEVEGQREIGLPFPDGYVYPMHGIPLSYLDQVVDAGISGTSVELGGERYPLKVRAFPQARNGIPNPAYDEGNGYSPVGAVSTHQVEEGQRCQGNNNCVPICPVQAKYHAGKTLAKALQTGKVELLTQAVASNVLTDPATGRVSGVEVKVYRDPGNPVHETGLVTGRIFVLAAGAIETARLLLASNLPSTSGLVGRNLMDHAYLLSWALLPEAAGTLRGTVCTGGIVDLRGGGFRSRQAAFSIDIHNDGWGWATGAPYSDLLTLVDDHNQFGACLRRDLAQRVSSQLLLAFMVEVLPTETNRVTVDPAHRDRLGNMRPVVSVTIPEYTMRGVAAARQVSKLIYQRLGAKDFTHYDPADPSYVQFEGKGYVIKGGNHLAGTHIMGTNKHNSVVDANQRSWDHENLYLVGGGSMPSIGSANVTLTLTALCYRTAKAMLAELH
jgi:choline dehydrogenase-like flavoprotein